MKPRIMHPPAGGETWFVRVREARYARSITRMESVPSTVIKTYPKRGPLQQFRFAESTAFRCFRCGDTKRPRLITTYGWQLGKASLQRLLRSSSLAMGRRNNNFLESAVVSQ